MERVKLTREERAEIFGGRFPTLYREEKPTYEKGSIYVLSWSRASRYSDDEGRVFSPPPQPLFWIRITSVKQRGDGKWAIRYDVVDKRDRTHFLRRTPPAYAVEADEPEPDQDEARKARESSSYTSTRQNAIDTHSALPLEEVDELTKSARKQEVEDYEKRRKRVEQALADLKNSPAVQNCGAPIRYVERKLGELDRKVRRVA